MAWKTISRMPILGVKKIWKKRWDLGRFRWWFSKFLWPYLHLLYMIFLFFFSKEFKKLFTNVFASRSNSGISGITHLSYTHEEAFHCNSAIKVIVAITWVLWWDYMQMKQTKVQKGRPRDIGDVALPIPWVSRWIFGIAIWRYLQIALFFFILPSMLLGVTGINISETVLW